jgi:hypothetical protein
LCPTAAAKSQANFPYGPEPVISSNGDTTDTAVVWMINGHGWPNDNQPVIPQPAVLYAFDAEHVNQPSILPLLWNSSQCPARDHAGNATKFAVPTVANGRVFMGTMDPSDTTKTRGQLDVYGQVSKPCN